jgi:NADPH-dependent glutamate synthase beta subunit-like oxidoreductase
VGIRELKRFVSENHSDLWKKNLMRPEATGKKVAILGSGPAGLTAAYYLARKGHEVTIFEQAPLPGGMLRQAISRKRLPKEALDDDIQEILNAGAKLKLNAGDVRIGQLFDDKFDAVFLAIGSTFVGPSAFWLKEEGIDLTSLGNIQVDTYNMATSRGGVFAGGDAVLGGITEDFIRYASSDNNDDFFSFLVDRLASNQGDSFRSATRTIASGKKVAEAIDQYLGGDGDLTESFLPPDEPNQYLGRQERFADLERLAGTYHSPVPQYAGLSQAEPALEQETATDEAKRCLRCDLRLKIKPVKFWGDY